MIESFFSSKAVDLIRILVEQLARIKKERQEQIDDIERTFGPLDQLVPYYIVPDAQNVNPADVAEDDTGLVARNNVFDLLNKFLSGSARFSHAFVLSDAGMGKTSLLVMLRLFYLNKFIQPGFEVSLLKIGPTTLEDIARIPKPHETVLLLDALDEDPEAWQHFYGRVQELLQATKMFRKVIVTCRTQFFPYEHEEDGRVPGQIVLGGFYCSKLFLSPFNDQQVDQYLRRKFQAEEHIERAKAIVEQMQSLKFRPMLLAYTDFLIEHEQHYGNAYSVYETLVDEWLNRELRKGVIRDKEVLRAACFVLADYMYKKRLQTLPSEEVMELCRPLEHGRYLENMSVEGRSLLQRTSAAGYKFAHYSILEFFVATSLAKKPEEIPNTDQVVSFLGDILAFRNLKNAAGLDLTKLSMRGHSLDSVTFRGSCLKHANLRGCSLRTSVFADADLTGANLAESTLTSANLRDAKCEGTDFTNADMTGSLLDNVAFKQCQMAGATLRTVRLDNASFSNTVLRGADLSNIATSDLDFSHADLANTKWMKSKIRHANMAEAILSSAVLDGVEMGGLTGEGRINRRSATGRDIHEPHGPVTIPSLWGRCPQTPGI